MRKIIRGRVLSFSGRMGWKYLFFREKGYSSGWLTRQPKRKRGQSLFLSPLFVPVSFLTKKGTVPFFFVVLGFALLFEKPCPLRLRGHSSSAHPDSLIGMSRRKIRFHIGAHIGADF